MYDHSIHSQMIHHHGFLLDAVDVVLQWDLSDDAFPDAVGAQANLMAGCYFD